jgi:cobyrinic acid a,c-diamide synthase
VRVVQENPIYPVGAELRGHEFHYTHLATDPAPYLRFALQVQRGTGFGGGHDGLTLRNVLACYTHVHALGTPEWAPALVAAARRWKSQA